MVMFQFCIIALLVGVSVGTVSSAIVLKIGAITIGIKKVQINHQEKKTMTIHCCQQNRSFDF